MSLGWPLALALLLILPLVLGLYVWRQRRLRAAAVRHSNVVDTVIAVGGSFKRPFESIRLEGFVSLPRPVASPSEDTRDRLLSAAEELFMSQGFTAPSLRAITSPVGPSTNSSSSRACRSR